MSDEEKTRMEVWVKQMKRLRKLPDTEQAHSDADGILCEVLISLGCKKLVDEWMKIDKWYA